MKLSRGHARVEKSILTLSESRVHVDSVWMTKNVNDRDVDDEHVEMNMACVQPRFTKKISDEDQKLF